MPEDILYDVAIAGGGLAGLALSIQLARNGQTVLLLEKEQYPFHRVCGEYISFESWDFLTGLGINLLELGVSTITKLEVSAASGNLLTQKLPLGGFGISRYILDNELARIARSLGVQLLENIKVNDIEFLHDHFLVDTNSGQFKAKVACGTFGKRSNLDIRWKRSFTMASKNKLNNYVGVKYHIQLDYPPDTIALHNFSNGYCGISKIEGNKYNLCYLTSAENLKKCDGQIKEMESKILQQNPHLHKIFSSARLLFESPLTISQISFDKKSHVENHILMIGDAAGMITPLCGNGMSMALYSSKIAFVQIEQFLGNQLTREQMETNYTNHWNKAFSRRLKTGRRIQRLFGSNWLTSLFIRSIKPFPKLVDRIIRQTHGKPF